MEAGMDATNITAPKAQSQPTPTNRQEMLDLLAQKIGVPIEETQQIWCTYQQEMHDRLDQMARAAESHGWKDPDDSSIKSNFYNIMAASRMLDLTEIVRLAEIGYCSPSQQAYENLMAAIHACFAAYSR